MDKASLKRWTGAPEYDALVRFLQDAQRGAEKTAMSALLKHDAALDTRKAVEYAGRAKGIGDVISHLENLFRDARTD